MISARTDSSLKTNGDRIVEDEAIDAVRLRCDVSACDSSKNKSSSAAAEVARDGSRLIDVSKFTKAGSSSVTLRLVI